MLEQVRRAYPQLPAAERKVADQLLQHPNAFMRSAVAEIARRAGVSQPTVIRFARSLGLAGLQELKLRLAGSLVGGVPYVHAAVASGDSTADMAAKVFDNAIAALIQGRNAVNPNAVERAIGMLASARRIEFYGLGNSGIVAADAQHKFFRFGLAVVAYADPHVQAMAASLLGHDDVVVAISQSGRTRDLLDAVAIALRGGCRVIAITEPGSPLAQCATVTIEAEAAEDAEVYSPMPSRLLHLALVDVLAVGVALALGDRVIATLERTKRALREHRR